MPGVKLYKPIAWISEATVFFRPSLYSNFKHSLAPEIELGNSQHFPWPEICISHPAELKQHISKERA